MPKRPSKTAKQLKSELKGADSTFKRQKGSHQIWEGPGGVNAILPDHGSKTIPIGTQRDIEKSIERGKEAARTEKREQQQKQQRRESGVKLTDSVQKAGDGNRAKRPSSQGSVPQKKGPKKK